MSELLPGRATPDATAALGPRVGRPDDPASYRSLGGLRLSWLGLGTYLGADDDATDALYGSAIVRALGIGVNVIDTAINYRNQRSERTIGRALASAISAGLVQREEIVIATKGGYLPFDGRKPMNPRGYFEETYVKPGLFAWSEVAAGCHCLSPRFLADQIERSRRNLGLETLDVYFLHNPETQLEEVAPAEFLGRLRAAFEVLEAACADGKIGCYGTATWNAYRTPIGAPGHIDLETVVRLAREVGGEDHHFRVIQIPYNAAMTEAATRRSQPRGEVVLTTLEMAEALGIYVMASAPILQGRLVRGAPPALAEAFPSVATEAQRALQFVRSTPGIGTALAGMKRVEHVEENTGAWAHPPAGAEVIRAMLGTEVAAS